MVGLREPAFRVGPAQRLQGRQSTQEKKSCLNHLSNSSTTKSSNPSLHSKKSKTNQLALLDISLQEYLQLMLGMCNHIYCYSRIYYCDI